MTSTIRLYCSTCNVVLTNPLSLGSSDPFDLCDADGEHRLQEGLYYIADNDDWATDEHTKFVDISDAFELAMKYGRACYNVW